MVIFIISLVTLLVFSSQQGYLDPLFSIFESDEESDAEVEEAYDTSDELHPLGEDCLNGHDGMAMHFHPYLTIIIDGDEIQIPENTGIDTEFCPSAMHVTHTHDASGKIHVESHEVVEVPLEVFFDVWGQHFDETGIFGYRNGSINMTVDGVVSQDYQNNLLQDAQQIIIEYTSD